MNEPMNRIYILLTFRLCFSLAERSNILMSKKRYQLPTLHSKMLGAILLALKTADNRWQINQLKFQLDKP